MSRTHHYLHQILDSFFNDPSSSEIYTLSLHDALPIFPGLVVGEIAAAQPAKLAATRARAPASSPEAGLGSRFLGRSEEHTSELQSQFHLVCRLLLEKKNQLHFNVEDMFKTYILFPCNT